MAENGRGQTQGNASERSWLSKVQQAFDPGHKMRQVSKKVCIYRVPRAMMVRKPEAYEPIIVPLGPYHHKMNTELSAMDQHKLEAVHRMLRRLTGVTISHIISEIQKLEDEIRECYEEEIEWNEETLCWMLGMDACFILEYIRFERDTDLFSLVFHKAGSGNNTSRSILKDILKLENQIPLVTLITLLQLEFNGSRERAVRKLAEMLRQFKLFQGLPFSSQLSGNDVVSKLEDHINKGACHLLDLHRMAIKDLLTDSSSQCATAGKSARISPNSVSGSTPTADLLQKAGIKFRSGGIGFQKRMFGGSTLSLPHISVDGDTDTLLRNLMAYEECQRCSWSPEKAAISSYIILIDILIDSEKDVSVLSKEGIIKNYLGSDGEVADIFNRVCDGITHTEIEQFEVVMKEARQHYNSQWKVWISQFKDEHCSKPWYAVSLVAAILILGMTAVQTFYSVESK